MLAKIVDSRVESRQFLLAKLSIFPTTDIKSGSKSEIISDASLSKANKVANVQKLVEIPSEVNTAINPIVQIRSIVATNQQFGFTITQNVELPNINTQM